jgi:hypothetical protein
MLTKLVPSYVRNVLEGKDDASGFSLADAVTLIAVLEHLVLDSSSVLLATLYELFRLNQSVLLPQHKVTKIVKEFLVYWTTGEKPNSAAVKNLDAMEVNRNWVVHASVLALAEGAVRGFMFERHGEPRNFFRERENGGAWHPLSRTFSFADVQTMVSGIVHTFGAFWAPECEGMKHALVKADESQTGRVLLSDFHTASAGGPWDFSESADYLRELGALDESLGSRGGRVIITNYLQATTNCVIRSPHYRVCCANECEEHMDELETIVGAPDASPEMLLSAVEDISKAWYGDEDLDPQFNEVSLGNRKPELPSSLRQQLHDISVAHGGKVPLHGRLFAQWLHYAFPHECSYPHKSGTVKAITPEEYGASFKASRKEISGHIQNEESLYDRLFDESLSLENDSDFMSQWDHEEELLAEHVGLKPPWQRSRRTTWFVLAFMGLFFAALCGGAFASKHKIDSHALSLYC